MSSRASATRLLKAPGCGLLALTTGSQQARALNERRIKGPAWGSPWSPHFTKRLKAEAPFWILGIPSDGGGGICRGAAHGPLRLREALYAAHPTWARFDLGDVPVVPQLTQDLLLNARQKRRSGLALWGASYRAGLPVSPLDLLEDTLLSCFKTRADFKPLILGGDHSISGAVFGALHRAGRTRRLAVLHIDAHTDLLEDRFGVEHCFGTWAAHAVKKLKHPEAWIQLGLRVSGRPQSYWEKRYGLQQIWAPQARKREPRALARELVAHWRSLGLTDLYVSFDVDGLDPKHVPSTGTPEPGGLGLVWTRTLLDECTRAMKLVAADIVELAPVLGGRAESARSVKSARQIVESFNWDGGHA
jgi:agmatinase